jgi:hypothetical protein
MYSAGELGIAPAGCQLDKDGDCNIENHPHPTDARDNYERVYGEVFLPHSCEEWVIGGPEEIRMLIRDLEEALVTLQPHQRPARPVL